MLSWPRDSEGANIRFGLPVIDDLDIGEEEEDFPAPPNASVAPVPKPPKDEFEGEKNPYVLDIKNLEELNSHILDPKKDCILFLSAQYCRTCKYLTPQYTKLARNNKGGDVVFAKANAVGKIGKEVSKALAVDAVPAFCLFRAGERYGTTINVSRIPSKKLDVALELLRSGDSWDGQKLRGLK